MFMTITVEEYNGEAWVPCAQFDSFTYATLFLEAMEDETHHFRIVTNI